MGHLFRGFVPTPFSLSDNRARFSKTVCLLIAVAIVAVISFQQVPQAQAVNNGLAITPPMGWNSWNRYGCGINETLIKAQADAMVSNGMAAAGYQYINLDDCWQQGSNKFAADIDKINVAGMNYEAESSANTIANGANVAACPNCSGAKMVNWIGANAGYMTFNGVNVGSGGTYQVAISYVNGDAGSRPGMLSINGGGAINVTFNPTGSWSTVGILNVNVALNAGSNSIKIYHYDPNAGRDSAGNILADTTAFPSGIASLANYVHSKGLKLGVYTDRGTATCARRAGSQGHEAQDARTYASWGVDYIKVDNCNTELDMKTQYTAWRDAIAASGRVMILSLCHWAFQSWDPMTGNLSRTTGDIQNNWNSMVGNFDVNATYAASAAPGYWNDPDMLEVGNGGMTTTEDQTHFSLWAIVAAPFITGNDLTTMSQATKDILMNSEVIAVNQDRLGIQGTKVSEAVAGLQVWSKKLNGTGQRAVVLFNRNTTAANITVNWSNIGLAAGNATVRDLWAHADRGTFSNSYTANVPAHGVVMVKITGTEPAVATGTTYVSDRTPIQSAQQWGSLHKDQSIDGNALKIRGTSYTKGLGTHADSSIWYYLGGTCSAFNATVGVDDEIGTNAASVEFKVFIDGAQAYASGLMNQTTAAKAINVGLSGKTLLNLVVSSTGDNIDFDHADWANAIITCGSLVPTNTPIANTNLALGKPSSANGQCATNETSAQAVDGSTTTKWCSGLTSGAAWLQVDLGANNTYTVNQFIVRHAGSGGEDPGFDTRDFKIQGSSDAATWFDLATTTGNTASITTHSISNVGFRYFRLWITNPQTSTSFIAARIYEFQIMGYRNP